MVGKTPKLHCRSDQTVDPQPPLLGFLIKVGKAPKLHHISDHTVYPQQQTVPGPLIALRKTRELQVELPVHLVVYDIFTRLPVKTLSRFRCVSKPLRSLISHPQFQKEHACRSEQFPVLLVAKADTTSVRFSTYTHDGEQLLKEFSISFAQPDNPGRENLRVPVPFKLIQSCLGLVCLRTYFDGAILVFNPLTEEVTTLPERPEQKCDLCVGFGYAASSDEFKVVRFFTTTVGGVYDGFAGTINLFDDVNVDCLSEVFTLGTSDGWKRTRSPPFKPSGSGPLVHGALHFLPSLYYHGNVRDGHYIFAFDIHTEQFRQIPLPEIYFGFQARANIHQCVMTEVRGSLCMSFDFFKSMKLLQLWFLKDYHGGMWVKEFNIDLSDKPYLFCPFAVTFDDCVLLSFESSHGYKLCYYNTKKKCVEKSLGIDCFAMFYVDSFLPLPLGNRMAA